MFKRRQQTKPQEVPVEVVKTTYDPTKTYKWSPDANFTFSGQEYGFIYNSLLQKKRELLRDLDILNVMESKLRAAVESGDAQEIRPEPAEKPTE